MASDALAALLVGKAFTSFSCLSQLFCVGAIHNYAIGANFCTLLQALHLGYRNLDLLGGVQCK